MLDFIKFIKVILGTCSNHRQGLLSIEVKQLKNGEKNEKDEIKKNNLKTK